MAHELASDRYRIVHSCCDLGQVTGGLVIEEAKIELIKGLKQEYIDELKEKLSKERLNLCLYRPNMAYIS
jgi:hypothetical protein